MITLGTDLRPTYSVRFATRKLSAYWHRYRLYVLGGAVRRKPWIVDLGGDPPPWGCWPGLAADCQGNERPCPYPSPPV